MEKRSRRINYALPRKYILKAGVDKKGKSTIEALKNFLFCSEKIRTNDKGVVKIHDIQEWT